MAAFLGGLFGAKTPGSAAAGAQTSLLSDWQSYSGRDVEAGVRQGAGSNSEGLFGAPGASLAQSATQAGSSVSSFLQTSFTTAKQSVSTGVAGLPSAESFRFVMRSPAALSLSLGSLSPPAHSCMCCVPPLQCIHMHLTASVHAPARMPAASPVASSSSTSSLL